MSRTEKHPYTKAKAVSKHCRNSNGKCLYCSGNRTYKNDKKSWKILLQKSASFYLAILVAVGVFSSCGHRTTDTQKGSISALDLSFDKNISVVWAVNEKDVITFVPINNSLPFSVNGTEYKNVIVKREKSKNTNSVKTIHTKFNIQKTIIITKTVKTEKTDYSNLYIGLFFVFCLFVFAWFKKWF